MLIHKAATAAAIANMKVKILTRDSLGRHVRNATQAASLQTPVQPWGRRAAANPTE
jgi:hypothetical protein